MPKHKENAANAIADAAGTVRAVAGRRRRPSAAEAALAHERRGRRRDPGAGVAKQRKTLLGGARTETSALDRQHVEGPAHHR